MGNWQQFDAKAEKPSHSTLNFLFIHAFSAIETKNGQRKIHAFALIKKDHLNNETNLWTFTRKLENKLLYVYLALSALSPAFFCAGSLIYGHGMEEVLMGCIYWKVKYQLFYFTGVRQQPRHKSSAWKISADCKPPRSRCAICTGWSEKWYQKQP